MSTIIMFIAVIIEIVFAIYCIITKSNQKPIRNWIRIVTFTMFVILSLTPVIPWSFKWKPLGVVLFVWAIMASISLIRKKTYKNEYRTLKVVFKSIGILMIVAIALLPAVMFSQHKLPEQTGEYGVDTVEYTYRDDSRTETFNDKEDKRKVTVKFWYPEDTEDQYPLVVFSHGAFGTNSDNESTFIELASNGYIVCSISHPYHSMFMIDSEGESTTINRTFLKEVIDVNNGVYDEETMYKLTHKWLELRIDDTNFVLDTIIENVKNSDSEHVYTLIDISRIGAMGHSLGGASSAQLGRERNDIKAVIDLDGGLIGEELDYVDNKYIINYEIYPVPILFITTDTMKQAMVSVTDPDIVIPQNLILDTAPEAYEVYLEGTNHFSVTDLPLFSPILVKMIGSSANVNVENQQVDEYEILEKTNSIVLEFFNANLKGIGIFKSAGVH